MRVRFWGTRGSLATPGRDTVRYGGNTSCVEVRDGDGTALVLDAGTGIRPLGRALGPVRRVDVLLTHLHMDHIQGLGFFAPLYCADVEVHLWGPASPVADLRQRLTRYLSPPLFPVRLSELPCRLVLHDVPLGRFEVPGFSVMAALVCHPGPAVGYRLEDTGGRVLTYLPDHEPALGTGDIPDQPEWTSGHDLAAGADVLIHDAQFADDEYPERVGWGHSTITQACAFAAAAGVGRLVAFHHDPGHDDATVDALLAQARRTLPTPIALLGAAEGDELTVG